MPANDVADAPPALLVAGSLDDCCAAPAVQLYEQLRTAHRPAELHMYAGAGHAFNLDESSSCISILHRPDRLADWLADEGFLDGPPIRKATHDVPSAAIPKPPGKGARLRWTICGLLFAAVVLSYIDRLVLSVLKPTLQQLYGWSETGYGDVVFWFQAAYGIGFLFFGRLIDRIGAKAGYALAVAVWTAAHMAHALFTSIRGFAIMRIVLALGESGTYPAALAAASEWFPTARARAGDRHLQCRREPRRDRHSDDRAADRAGDGLARRVRDHGPVQHRVDHRLADPLPPSPRAPAIKPAELAYIEADPVEEQKPVAWRRLLTTRQAWAYMSGRFLIDPIWWTFLFWLPDFFHKRYGLDLKSFGPPLVAVYVLADIGSIARRLVQLEPARTRRDRRTGAQAGDARLRHYRGSGDLRRRSARASGSRCF